LIIKRKENAHGEDGTETTNEAKEGRGSSLPNRQYSTEKAWRLGFFMKDE
jgi:hypothetical protein